MQRLEPRFSPPGAGDVLCFSCVRDEALRLPWFLEYHRRIGVDRFFVVDNGSSDGSTDFLLDQADVTVYYTVDSYAANRCGMVWLDELLESHGNGHWSLTLDADELLVYPSIRFSVRPALKAGITTTIFSCISRLEVRYFYEMPGAVAITSAISRARSR